MAVAAERAPDLVDKAAFRRAEQAPGQRAEQRRQIIGHRHQLLEQMSAGHVGARQNPRHDETEHQRHYRGGNRHRQCVEQDLRVLEYAVEILEPVRGRRPHLRVADVERCLQQKEHRVQDQNRGDSGNSIASHFLRGDQRSRGWHGRSAHRPSIPFHSLAKISRLAA